MSKKWTLPALILFLGSTAALQAHPLDSPDIVYIDGLPCNRACQSYLAWSDRALSGRHRAERETSVAVPAEAEAERVEAMAHPRPARHAAPMSRTAPHAGKAAQRAAASSASKGTKIVGPRAAPPVSGRDNIPAATATVTSGSPDDQDNLVALVLAGPEINSLSDLNNRNIAIEEKQSASSGRVSAALMAAGAAEVQFSEAKASAIERLISGEVPAAVLLASREIADLFPELAGFRTFRLPLVQKARL